jgi:exosome complex exonuclease RRP6
MEPAQDFKSLQERIQKSLVSTVKTVNRLAAEDLDFQRTVNPDVAEQLDEKSQRVLDLSSRLLRSAASACGLKAPTFEDVDDIDLNWRGVVDVVDTVLEKADTALDEYTGLIKRKDPPTGDSVSASPSLLQTITDQSQAPEPKKPRPSAKVVRNANITKPQAHFEIPPDNFPTGPWKPILTKKPHATVPLEKSLVTFKNGSGSVQYVRPGLVSTAH